jgi:hypothetical protein
MKVRVLVSLVSAVLAPLILTACQGGGSTGNNTSILTKIGTDPASVVAGASFSDSIRVQVIDGSSNPKSGVSVAFAVTAGGGTVTPATVITDANGKGAAKFMTGTTMGTNTATATVTGLPALTFSAATRFWSSASIGATYPLHSVWGTSASDVWAVGNAGTILHYDGTSWSSVSSGTLQAMNSVWGTSSSNVWAVGQSGTILHGSP